MKTRHISEFIWPNQKNLDRQGSSKYASFGISFTNIDLKKTCFNCNGNYMEIFGVRIHLSLHCCLVRLFRTRSNDHSIPRLTTKNVHFDSQPQQWTRRGLSRYGDCHLRWGPIRTSSDIPPNHWIDWLSRLFTACFPTKWWTPDFWTTISNSYSF